jgi:hypothetical protein
MDADPVEPKDTVAKRAVVRAAGVDRTGFHPRSYAG